MDRHEAKLRLQAFRVGRDDSEDPVFAEALRLARQDPELSHWLQEQQALNHSLSEKLREIPVPEDLKSNILAAYRVSKKQPRIQRREWLALAALFLVLLIPIGKWLNRIRNEGPVTFDAYQHDMVKYLSRGFYLDLATDDPKAIRDWLANEHGFTGYAVPAGLEQYPSIGCRVIRWHSRQSVLICFDVNGELVHLFVIPVSELPDGPASPERSYARIGQWTTASWAEGERCYYVATRGDEQFLKQSL